MSIEIKELNFSYGEKLVLDSVSLVIEPGETLSVLGPNGAGKTTLLNIAAGLLKQTGGTIVYNGRIRERTDLREMAKLVGYVPQFIVPAFDYSVLEYVVSGCAPDIAAFGRPGQKHYDTAMKAIEEIGIGHLAEKSYKQISGGERQQASIARVLAQSPAYILMDEPTSHLDYGNQLRVLQTIKKLAGQGYGVVFTTHNPDQVLLLGGKTAIIDRAGKLISSDSNELISGELLSGLYGTELRVSKIDGQGRDICFAPKLDGEL